MYICIYFLKFDKNDIVVFDSLNRVLNTEACYLLKYTLY